MERNNRSRIADYLKPERKTLALIAVSGVLYNIGMTAGPWFEGKLAQYLCDIIQGSRGFRDMVQMALFYVGAILLVQAARYIKRLYVRRFGNDISRHMKEDLYRSMLAKSKAQLEQEGVGPLMTKAAADVDTCAEGIRKFTTEIFDTGVVMAAYWAMLFYYDPHLTLLAMIFPPIAYLIANKLKTVVARSARAYKESAGRLNEATYDRVGNALTYRIYGQETGRDRAYEACLVDYEKKAVRANIWENVMQPLYLVISMAGSLCILWFGGKNVLGTGWAPWDIAAFVTYLSCFTKLAAKSSKAAKLFNSVQKAAVSWRRIQPMLKKSGRPGQTESAEQKAPSGQALASADGVAFRYGNGPLIFSDVTFSVFPGEIIGVTGPIACGKSTLGKLFLGELPYQGQLSVRGGVVYMGHEPELICGTIEENILLGYGKDAWEALSWVKMEQEVRQMPEGINTRVGNDGVTLSGGQQARIALARTLHHRQALLVLDDPFSAVDMGTEQEIFANIQKLTENGAVILFSHRLSLFPQMDRVLWMENGKVTVSTHQKLMETVPKYAGLYRSQTSGLPKTPKGDGDSEK